MTSRDSGSCEMDEQCVSWSQSQSKGSAQALWSPEDRVWVPDVGPWAFYRVKFWVCSDLTVTVPLVSPVDIRNYWTCWLFILKESTVKKLLIFNQFFFLKTVWLLKLPCFCVVIVTRYPGINKIRLWLNSDASVCQIDKGLIVLFS